MRLSGVYETSVFMYNYPFLGREYETAVAWPLYFNRFIFFRPINACRRSLRLIITESESLRYFPEYWKPTVNCSAIFASVRKAIRMLNVCKQGLTILLVSKTVWVSWQSYRHLWADFLEDVGASTSHTPMRLHGLLQRQLLYLYLYL
jgi:hypothetical protein